LDTSALLSKKSIVKSRSFRCGNGVFATETGVSATETGVSATKSTQRKVKKSKAFFIAAPKAAAYTAPPKKEKDIFYLSPCQKDWRLF